MSTLVKIENASDDKAMDHTLVVEVYDGDTIIQRGSLSLFEQMAVLDLKDGQYIVVRNKQDF